MNRFYFDREENAYQLKEENEKLMLEINRLSNVPKKLSTSSFTSKPPNFSDLIKDLSICNSKTKSLWSKDEKSEGLYTYFSICIFMFVIDWSHINLIIKLSEKLGSVLMNNQNFLHKY